METVISFFYSFFYDLDNLIAGIMVMSLLLGFNKKFILSEQKIFQNFKNILIIYFVGGLIYNTFVDNDLPLLKSAVFIGVVPVLTKGCNFVAKKIKKTFKKIKKR